MKVKVLKSSHKGLFSFSLTFRCSDYNGGERHFLEHMVFSGTDKLNRQQISSRGAELGIQDCLSARTWHNEMCFSGTYLKEYQSEIAHFLCDLLLNSTLKKNEIEKERKIIKEELAGQEKCETELSCAFFKKQNIDTSIIGCSNEQIDRISQHELTSLAKKLFCKNRAELTISSDCKDFSDIIKQRLPQGESEVTDHLFFPESLNIVSKNTNTNKVSMVFDIIPDQTFRGYNFVKSSMEGLFWKKLREKEQLFYRCGFQSTYMSNQSPYVTLAFETTKDPEIVISRLLKNLTLESESVYQNVKKEWILNARKKMTKQMEAINGWCGQSLGGISIEDVISEEMPTYEELEQFTSKLKKAKFSTVSILTKKQKH